MPQVHWKMFFFILHHFFVVPLDVGVVGFDSDFLHQEDMESSSTDVGQMTYLKVYLHSSVERTPSDQGK